MNSFELPRLKYFMSCYYHQDWALDADSANDVDLWAFYFTNEQLNSDVSLQSEVQTLLAAHNDEILAVLSEYQSGGRQWKSPTDARQWLNNLEQYLNSRNLSNTNGASI